jgi:HlyD family secretion protein/macrolide-specific efflux system membrane fusion protein
VTQKKKRKLWPWALGVLLIGTAAVAVSRKPQVGPEKIDESLVITLKREDLAIDVVETGRVQPREKVEIKSKVAGQVEKVFVDEGDAVKKGQPLLRLDPTDFRRDVARCEADVAQAKNGIEFAALTLDRKKRGLADRGVAAAEVELAENDLKVKKVQLQTAAVALAAAEDRLRYTQISSPMDGIVIQRGIQPGEVVTPGVQATFEGKPLLTVADLSTLVVKAEFNQIDVARIAIGQKVTLTLDSLPGRTFSGKVSRVAPASTQPKGKDIEVFPVEATVEGDASGVRPGMTADLRIHLERKPNVTALPIEAVVKDKDSGKSFVTKVLSIQEGRAKTDKVAVKLGAKNDRQVEIVDGVKEGDRILIKPGSAAENEYK